MKNSEEILRALLESPRNKDLAKLFGDQPLCVIHEYILHSKIKMVFIDNTISEPWVRLFAYRSKEEILCLLKQAIKKQSQIIQMPSDDPYGDTEYDVTITKICFCPECKNLLSLNGDSDIDCQYCNS